MMNIIKKYNQYIKGDLAETEMEAFTKEIVKDHFEKEKLQNKWNQILQDEHNDQGSTERSKKIFFLKNSKRFMIIGASSVAIILFSMFAWLIYQSHSTSPYEKLLSMELNKPYIETLSRKGSVEELRLQAIAAYNIRDYAAAARYFKQISKIDQALDWNFYIGLCQLYQKDADLAIETFTAILEHPGKKYNIETNWYLGLAYVMNKDFKSAKNHLEFVADRSNDEMAWKVKEARELLNVLPEKE